MTQCFGVPYDAYFTLYYVILCSCGIRLMCEDSQWLCILSFFHAPYYIFHIWGWGLRTSFVRMYRVDYKNVDIREFYFLFGISIMRQ